MERYRKTPKLQCNRCTEAQDTRAGGSQAKINTGIGTTEEAKSAKVARVRIVQERLTGEKTKERKEERVKRKEILTADVAGSVVRKETLQHCVRIVGARVCMYWMKVTEGQWRNFMDMMVNFTHGAYWRKVKVISGKSQQAEQKDNEESSPHLPSER